MSKKSTAFSIALIGPMGAGKSTIGKLLSQKLRRPFIDLDAEIELRAGADITWIFEIEGESGFRNREQKALAEICAINGQIISTGGGAVLREANRAILNAHTHVVYLRTSTKIQWERTKHDTRRPLLQTPDAKAKLEALAQERNPLYEALADITVDTDRSSAMKLCDQIISALNQMDMKA